MMHEVTRDQYYTALAKHPNYYLSNGIAYADWSTAIGYRVETSQGPIFKLWTNDDRLTR